MIRICLLSLSLAAAALTTASGQLFFERDPHKRALLALEMLDSAPDGDLRDAQLELIRQRHPEGMRRVARSLLTKDHPMNPLEQPVFLGQEGRLAILPHLFAVLPEGELRYPEKAGSGYRPPGMRIASAIVSLISYEKSGFPQETRDWAGALQKEILVARWTGGSLRSGRFQQLPAWWARNRRAVEDGRPGKAGWLPTTPPFLPPMYESELARRGDATALALENLHAKGFITRMEARLHLLQVGQPNGIASLSDALRRNDRSQNLSLPTQDVFIMVINEYYFWNIPAALSDLAHPTKGIRLPNDAIPAAIAVSGAIGEGRFAFPEATVEWMLAMQERLIRAADPRTGASAEEDLRLMLEWFQRNSLSGIAQLKSEEWLPPYEPWRKDDARRRIVEEALLQRDSGDPDSQATAVGILLREGHVDTLDGLLDGFSRGRLHVSPFLDRPELLQTPYLPRLFKSMLTARDGSLESDDSKAYYTKLAKLITGTIAARKSGFPPQTRAWAGDVGSKLYTEDGSPSLNAGTLGDLRSWWKANAKAVTLNRIADASWLPADPAPAGVVEREAAELRTLLGDAESGDRETRFSAELRLVSASHLPTITRILDQMLRGEHDGNSLTLHPFAKIQGLGPIIDATSKPAADSPRTRLPGSTPVNVVIAKLAFDIINRSPGIPDATRTWALGMKLAMTDGNNRHTEADQDAIRQLNEWWSHNRESVEQGRLKDATWLPAGTPAGD